jgi:lipoprotein-anchoring transpeptidase ErfK/SrfK
MRAFAAVVLVGVLVTGGCARVAAPGRASGGAPVVPSASVPVLPAKPPKGAKPVRVFSFLGDGRKVGAAMPLIIRFGHAVAPAYRAAVQQRLTVRSAPDQPGLWHWISPAEVHYRPPAFWLAGTRISYRARLAGVPLAIGWYGRSDLSVDVIVARSFVMTVDDRTKRMTVREGGKVVRTIPVSLGKPATPSSSGTMVVIEKSRHTVFDTTDELGPDDGYQTKIDFAQRLTWGGEFIHAAPWSEGAQGKTDVSHGCVNVSEKMGAWLFARTLVGDPITITGTGRKLRDGNGWTDWNQSWAQWAGAA